MLSIAWLILFHSLSVSYCNTLFLIPSQLWLLLFCHIQNCTERENVLNPNNRQKLVLDIGHNTGCSKVTVNTTRATRYMCSDERVFVSSRERWWYIAVSHCQPLTVSLSAPKHHHFMNSLYWRYFTFLHASCYQIFGNVFCFLWSLRFVAKLSYLDQSELMLASIIVFCSKSCWSSKLLWVSQFRFRAV